MSAVFTARIATLRPRIRSTRFSSIPLPPFSPLDPILFFLLPERSSRFPRNVIYTPMYKPSNDKKNIRKISRHEKEKPPPLLHTPSSTATRITNFRVLARSRVSYARQIAVMTVHRGKKCHVRGKQNVSRAYVPPSPPLTSSPLLAHGSEVPLIRRVFSDPLPLPFVYIYARFSCCFCGRQETRETNVEGTDVEKKRLCPDGSGSSIDEKYHRAISGETTEAMIDVF